MNSFVVGRVLDPETQKSPKGKLYINFGLLVGKSSTEFSIWEDSKAYNVASSLCDGDTVCVICNSTISDKGQLRTYVNDIAFAPEGLRSQLLSLFRGPTVEQGPTPKTSTSSDVPKK